MFFIANPFYVLIYDSIKTIPILRYIISCNSILKPNVSPFINPSFFLRRFKMNFVNKLKGKNNSFTNIDVLKDSCILLTK